MSYLAAYLAIGALALACLIARAGGIAAVRRNAGDDWREFAAASAIVVVGWPVAIVLIARRVP